MEQPYITLTRIPGEWICTTTATFPAYHYKYRHDKLIADGMELQGLVQVRVSHGRTETTTCHGHSCVMGYQPEWLIRQQ